MIQIRDSTAIFRTFIEPAAGKLIDSLALGTLESAGSAGLRAISRRDVLVAPGATVAAAAGRKVRPPEPQQKMRRCQQKDR